MSRHTSLRTTVRLPPDLLARAKRKAARDGRTLTSLIEEGLRLTLIEKPAQRDPSVPRFARISTATGGPLPGFGIIKLSDVQAIDDIEYMKRFGWYREET